MRELKPCPFCGGSVHVDRNELFVCESCGVVVRFPMSLYQRANATSGLVVGNFDPCWHNAKWNERTVRTCVLTKTPNVRYCREDAECSECGSITSYYDRYCHNCGAKVVDE